MTAQAVIMRSRRPAVEASGAAALHNRIGPARIGQRMQRAAVQAPPAEKG